MSLANAILFDADDDVFENFAKPSLEESNVNVLGFDSGTYTWGSAVFGGPSTIPRTALPVKMNADISVTKSMPTVQKPGSTMWTTHPSGFLMDNRSNTVSASSFGSPCSFGSPSEQVVPGSGNSPLSDFRDTNCQFYPYSSFGSTEELCSFDIFAPFGSFSVPSAPSPCPDGIASPEPFVAAAKLPATASSCFSHQSSPSNSPVSNSSVHSRPVSLASSTNEANTSTFFPRIDPFSAPSFSDEIVALLSSSVADRSISPPPGFYRRRSDEPSALEELNRLGYPTNDRFTGFAPDSRGLKNWSQNFSPRSVTNESQTNAGREDSPHSVDSMSSSSPEGKSAESFSSPSTTEQTGKRIRDDHSLGRKLPHTPTSDDLLSFIGDDELDSKVDKRQRRRDKNRQAAALSRLRKKAFLEATEQKVTELSSENSKLKEALRRVALENVVLREDLARASLLLQGNTSTSSSPSSHAVFPQ